MKLNLILLSLAISLTSCAKSQLSNESSETTESSKDTVITVYKFPTRIDETPLPDGYIRDSVETNSFGEYLRNLSLKPEGSPVLLYDGRESGSSSYAYSVIDMEIGTEDLQQCADAVIRLRAEYLYHQKRYNEINFNFTNGFKCKYDTYAHGGRVNVRSGKYTNWYQAKQGTDYSYETFREYLNLVFMYAGTASLSKELKSVTIDKIEIGDVFIQGGFPGHAMIVVDLAKNPTTGDVAILVAQSFMPARDIHVVSARRESPWFFVKDFMKEGYIYLQSWTFNFFDIKRFK